MGSGNEIAPGGLLRLVNINMAALEPYHFEPERVCDVADDKSSEDNELNERLESTFWCSCRKCVVVLTPKDCICCVEHPESENKKQGTLALRNRNSI